MDETTAKKCRSAIKSRERGSGQYEGILNFFFITVGGIEGELKINSLWAGTVYIIM